MSYIKYQLTEVRQMIKRDKELIEKYPARFGLKVGLRSLEAHEKELIAKMKEAAVL